MVTQRRVNVNRDGPAHPRRPRSEIRKAKPDSPAGNPAPWPLRTLWTKQTQTRATLIPSPIYARNSNASHGEATRLLLSCSKATRRTTRRSKADRGGNQGKGIRSLAQLNSLSPSPATTCPQTPPRTRPARAQLEPTGRPMASQRFSHPRRPQNKIHQTKPNSPAGNPASKPLRSSFTKQTQSRTTPMPSSTYTRPRFPLHAFRPRRVNIYVTRLAKGVCLPAAP
jgi:hypothetical protein